MRFVSHPVSESPSQSPKFSAQWVVHIPAMHRATSPTAARHGVLQLPQWSFETRVSTQSVPQRDLNSPHETLASTGLRSTVTETSVTVGWSRGSEPSV